MIGFDGYIKNTRKQKDLYNFTRYLSNKDIMQFQKNFLGELSKMEL